MGATRSRGQDAAATARAALTLDRGAIVRVVAIAVFLAIALFVLPTIGADWTTTFTSVAIYSIITLGLGILYGRVGLISLGQVALLVIGVWTATRLNFATGLSFPIVLLLSGVITCAIGVLIGLPAIRLSGLYLALITLMAAGAVNVVLVAINFPNGGGGFTGRTSTPDLSGLEAVRRPGIAEGDTAYYRYVVVVAALIFIVALLHVRGKPGRAWAAIRESEPAALAAGVNVVVLQALGVRPRLVHGRGRRVPARGAGRPADGAVLPDPGLADAPRDDAHRRHLQPLGRGHRGLLQPAPAVPLPGAVGHQPELPAHHVRRRPAPGAPHRARRPRRPVPEGHGQARPPGLARRRQADRPGGEPA